MTVIPKPLKFLLWSALAQIIGFGAGLFARDAPPLIPFVSHSAVAFVVARLLYLPLPWQILNLAVPWIIILAANYAIPEWALVMCGGIYLLVYLPTFWTRVPFYPSSRGAYEAVLGLLPEDRDFSFIDLGCGFGTMLGYLATHRPRGKFVGVEVGVLPYLIAKLRSLFHKNISVSFESIWSTPLERYEIVYAFLAPGPMPDIWKKAKAEMPPGTLFLSNSFPAPVEHTSAVPLAHGDGRQETLFVYDMR